MFSWGSSAGWHAARRSNGNNRAADRDGAFAARKIKGNRLPGNCLVMGLRRHLPPAVTRHRKVGLKLHLPVCVARLLHAVHWFTHRPIRPRFGRASSGRPGGLSLRARCRAAGLPCTRSGSCRCRRTPAAPSRNSCEDGTTGDVSLARACNTPPRPRPPPRSETTPPSPRRRGSDSPLGPCGIRPGSDRPRGRVRAMRRARRRRRQG